jgi:integrase
MVVNVAMKESGLYSPNTINNYRSCIRRFIGFMGTSVRAFDVTFAILTDFYKWNVKKGSTDKHANELKHCVSAVVKFANPEYLPEIIRGGRKRRDQPLRANYSDSNIEGTLEWYLIEQYFPAKSRIASPNTENHYGIVIASLSRFLGRPSTPSDLSDLIIGKWIRSMKLDNLSARTINGNLDKIRALWNWLAKRRIVDLFPTIENVPVPRQVPKCWREDELKSLFSATEQMRGLVGGIPAAKWWKAFLLFAWDSGERKSAILGIRWEHLDAKNGTIEVPAEIRKGGRKPMVYQIKSTTLLAIELLRSYNNRRIFEYSDHNATFYNDYKRLLRLAELPYIRYKSGPQKIRRTFASFIEAAGGNATDALAHTQRSITIESYIDPTIAQTVSPNVHLFHLDTLADRFDVPGTFVGPSLSRRQVAEMCKVHPSAINGWVAKGMLKRRRAIDGSQCYAVADVKDLIANSPSIRSRIL